MILAARHSRGPRIIRLDDLCYTTVNTRLRDWLPAVEGYRG